MHCDTGFENYPKSLIFANEASYKNPRFFKRNFDIEVPGSIRTFSLIEVY